LNDTTARTSVSSKRPHHNVWNQNCVELNTEMALKPYHLPTLANRHVRMIKKR